MPELPIADAAQRLGLTTEAIRKRLARGTLHGEKRGGQWFVVVDEATYNDYESNLRTGRDAPEHPDTSGPPDADDRTRQDDGKSISHSADLATTRALLAVTEAERDRLAGIVDAMHRQLERADVERAELRRLLGAEQQRAAELQSALTYLLPAPQVSGEEPPPRRSPWWAFWRRHE